MEQLKDKKKFLCFYEYGTGAVWLYIYAHSEHDITEKFPELRISHEKPEWLKGKILRNKEKNMTFDIDEPPSGYLLDLVKNRNKSHLMKWLSEVFRKH